MRGCGNKLEQPAPKAEVPKTELTESDKNFGIGCLGIFIFLIFIVALSSCGSGSSSSSGSHKRLEDATNKEVSDFMKWKAKEDQKKHDNSPAFK